MPLDECEGVGGGLVMARGDPPTLLHLVEKPLHQIPGAIEVAAKADWLCPVPLRRDVCPRAMLADKCSDPIRVKSTFGEQHGSRSQAGQQGENETVVVRFARGQRARRTGSPQVSTTARILVVSPPRDRSISCSRLAQRGRRHQPDFTSALRSIADMARPAAGSSRVETDPDRSSAIVSYCSSEVPFAPFRDAQLSRYDAGR
jgi:hypothetical protein